MAVIENARATHTTLECRDVAQSLRFYREVMGLFVNQPAALVGHVWDTRGLYAASLQSAQCTQQPLLNFYARPVKARADVDPIYAQVVAVRDRYSIREVTAPTCENRDRFGVGSYGFYINDCDGNWWRIEENDGAFGPVDLSAAAPGAGGSIVPAGPISYVALESAKVTRSIAFYRDVLGLLVEQPAPHYGLCRSALGCVNTVVVEVGDRLVPQKVSNHHGLTLDVGPEIIDALRQSISDAAGAFGIRKVLPATRQHGSYSFYVQDADTNCWEIESWDDGISPVERGLLRVAH
ncbi:MAG: VOC family protein [Polyangiaceae bacterium]